MLRIKTCLAAALLLGSTVVFAGNPDRIGQAGATQLNINPWARSSGLGWGSVSSVRGLESMFVNVGGLAYVEKTELAFANTSWLVGTGVQINSFGIAQNLNGDGVLGLSVMTTDIGEIEITTTDLPEGGIGTVSPRLTNIGVSYSQKFTSTISGGVLVRVHSESITNVRSQGIAVDAGIQYTETSNKKDKLKKNDIKFGISLKNVGPDATFEGDGLSFKALNPINEQQQTYQSRSAQYGLPTLINIGASYDFRLDATNETFFHRLTPVLTFTSHAFSRNQFTGGVEYAYKKVFMLRGAYAYEQGILDAAQRTNALTGLMAGFSLQLPLGADSDNVFGIDYSYRHSNPFSGSHSVGVRLTLQ